MNLQTDELKQWLLKDTTMEKLRNEKVIFLVEDMKTYPICIKGFSAFKITHGCMANVS